MIKSESINEKEAAKIKKHKFFCVNNSFKKKNALKSLYSKNPKLSKNLIIIIDEWHSKNILKEFKTQNLNQEAFWKKFFFGKGELFNELKVFCCFCKVKN